MYRKWVAAQRLLMCPLVLAAAALAVSACGSDDGSNATDPQLVAAPTEAPAVVSETPTPFVLPTSPPAPVEPTATAVPQATSTPEPISTATPTPTAQSVILVGCFVEPSEAVVVGDVVRITAVADRGDVEIAYIVDHGDGTTREARVSETVYTAPGSYAASVAYSHADGDGEAQCGTVVVNSALVDGVDTVDPAFAQYLGLELAEAGVLSVRNGFVFRIASTDGSPRILADDVRSDRLNFDVDDGVVVGVAIG